MASKFIPPAECRICGGTMKEGIFMPNGNTNGYTTAAGQYVASTSAAETWWEIAYHESSFLGATTKGKVLTGAGTPFWVIHYRCQDCGYLESYAPESVQV